MKRPGICIFVPQKCTPPLPQAASLMCLGNSFHVSWTWDSLGSLHLWVYSLHQIRNTCLIFLKILLILPLPSSGNPITSMLGNLMLFHISLFLHKWLFEQLLLLCLWIHYPSTKSNLSLTQPIFHFRHYSWILNAEFKFLNNSSMFAQTCLIFPQHRGQSYI